MGWTFFRDHAPSQTRANIIRREFEHTPSITNPWAYGFEMLATRGAVVYGLMWRENPSEGTQRQYFGIVFLTQRKNGEFGYKEIGEECGPYYYDAPLKIIDALDRLAPVPADSNAAGWRVRTRANHEKRNAKRRARAVAAAITQRSGIAAERLIVSHIGG